MYIFSKSPNRCMKNIQLKQIITETGASSTADMGKVMGAATKKLAGRADGKAISAAVKELLAK